MRYPGSRLCIWRRAVVLAAVVTLQPAVGDADVIDSIASHYADATEVAGSFRQILTSGHDGQELTYTGRYRYTPGEGLEWEVRSPIEGTLRIDRNGDAEASGELGGMSILTRRTVGRLIVAMVSMDREVLERYYVLTGHRDEEGFEILLVAHENWKRQAGNVTIRGDELVESVQMSLPDGRNMALELEHGPQTP